MTKPRHHLTWGLVGCVADPPPPALCPSCPTPGPSRGCQESGSQDAQAGAPAGGPRIRRPGSRDSVRAAGEAPPAQAPSAAVLAAARPHASQSLPGSQVWRWVLLCWDLSRACGLHTSRGLPRHRACSPCGSWAPESEHPMCVPSACEHLCSTGGAREASSCRSHQGPGMPKAGTGEAPPGQWEGRAASREALRAQRGDALSRRQLPAKALRQGCVCCLGSRGPERGRGWRNR